MSRIIINLQESLLENYKGYEEYKYRYTCEYFTIYICLYSKTRKNMKEIKEYLNLQSMIFLGENEGFIIKMD